MVQGLTAALQSDLGPTYLLQAEIGVEQHGAQGLECHLVNAV